MKNISLWIAVSLLCISTQAFSQTKAIGLSINPLFSDLVLDLSDSSFSTNDSSNLQIENLKFYISNIQFLKDNKVVLAENNSFHLIDASNKKSLNISIDNHRSIGYDEIKFGLGIDSITNVAGVLGGDLDPTKGMYWTWQSGYINFKLEGKSSICKTRNNEFTFHLGGYQQPFDAYQTVTFSLKNNERINIGLDVQSILSQIDLIKTNHIMSPNQEAVLLSKLVAASFNVLEN